MKKILVLSFLIFLITALTASAVVRTVSNRADVKAQYSNLQAAIDASSNGDILYVQASPQSYGSVHIPGQSLNKSLTLIGGGYNPDNSNGYKTIVDWIAVEALWTDCGSNMGYALNTIIKGFYFNDNGGISCWCSNALTYNYLCASNPGANNITIQNCNIPFIKVWGSNWNICNNIIRGYIDLTLQPISPSTVIQNNIFYYNGPSIQNCSQATTIRNNIFTGYTGSNPNAFSSVTNADIIQNIFYGVGPGGATGCYFASNLTYSTNQDDLPYGTNNGSNNATGDPLFTTVPNGYGGFNYNYDFTLQTGSPAIIDASTQMGIFGGYYPFPRHVTSPNLPDYTGQPYMPLIQSFTLTGSTTITGSGTLNFSVTVGSRQ